MQPAQSFDQSLHYYKNIQTDNTQDPVYERVYTMDQIKSFESEESYYCFKLQEK
jgi:hypothetical protein